MAFPARPLVRKIEPRTTSRIIPATRPPAHTRAYERLPFEVRIDESSDHNFYAALSLDVAEGGIFGATHLRYEVGTQVEVQLLLPEDEEPITLITAVRWTRAHKSDSDASPGLGLRFVELPPHVVPRIEGF